MEAALPRHMTADRMARIALTSLRVNPKLMNCSRESFFGSLMAASQLGFEPGINGQCYLIPYGNVCTLVPGWRGYLDLVSRTERASAWTEAVYEGDEFEYTLGTNPEIHHKRGKWAGKEAALQYVYAVGRIKNNDFPIIDVWDIDKVWAHRSKQNKVGDRHYSYAHPEMYARKIPLLQVIKYLPSSIEIASASALDITASEGRQNLTIDMALKGDLESGGDSSAFNPNDPEEQELEELFEKLGKNPTERKALRDSYIPRGARQELVNWLRGKLAPAINVTTQASKTEASTEQASTEAPQEKEKNGRGRPSNAKIAARKAQEEAQQEASTQPETQAQAGQQEEKPTQTNTSAGADKFSF
jgi:phage RecT family recombinase